MAKKPFWRRREGDPNARDQNGMTPLHRAASAGNAHNVRRYIQDGADVNARDVSGRTPLHWAADSLSGPEAVNQLLKAGADPNARDREGWTPLQQAVASDSDESVKHLLEAKASPAVADSAGRTPLHYAAANCSPENTERLLKAGADPNARDHAGRTPLDVATARRDRLDPSRRNDEAVRLFEKAATPQKDTTAARAQQPEPSGKERGGRGQRAKKPFWRRGEDYAGKVSGELIEQIKGGVAPWQKPWRPGERGTPENFATGQPYRGGNSLYLMSRAIRDGRGDNRWGTYNQIQAAGGQVRKGEKGTQVLFFTDRTARALKDDKGKVLKDDDGKTLYEEERRGAPICKQYTVFNVEQADGLELKPRPSQARPEWDAHRDAEKVIAASGAKVEHIAGDRAYYRMTEDKIVLPEPGQFPTRNGYYQTALHECGHATGHPDRMDRDTLQEGLDNGFGSPEYAREELRAEIGAMMTGERVGVGHDPQRGAAYVEGWVKVLEEDPHEIHRAARDAQKMSDYLLERAVERERDAPVKEKTAAELTREYSHARGPQISPTPKTPAQQPAQALQRDAGPSR